MDIREFEKMARKEDRLQLSHFKDEIDMRLNMTEFRDLISGLNFQQRSKSTHRDQRRGEDHQKMFHPGVSQCCRDQVCPLHHPPQPSHPDLFQPDHRDPPACRPEDLVPQESEARGQVWGGRTEQASSHPAPGGDILQVTALYHYSSSTLKL